MAYLINVQMLISILVIREHYSFDDRLDADIDLWWTIRLFIHMDKKEDSDCSQKHLKCLGKFKI